MLVALKTFLYISSCNVDGKYILQICFPCTVGIVGNALVSINEVNLCRAQSYYLDG